MEMRRRRRRDDPERRRGGRNQFLLQTGRRFRQPDTLPSALVGVHRLIAVDRRCCGCGRRRLQQIGIGVAEGVDADAADEVELGGAVGHPHPRALTSGRKQGGEEQGAAALAPDLLERGLVLAGRERALLGLGGDGLDQGPGGFAHPGGGEQAL